MLGRAALLTAFFMSLFPPIAHGATGQATAQAKKAAQGKWAVKKVRQKDGSVVVRLDMHRPTKSGGVLAAEGTQPFPGTLDAPSGKTSRGTEHWLDVPSEPKAMTALATVALDAGNEAKPLGSGVDPANVRSWAEFVDPDLYLRWMAAGVDSRYRQAIHNRSQEPILGTVESFFPVRLEIPANAQAGVPLKPTLWTNAYVEGRNAQDAAKEWLMLPMPDPKSNPWLRPSQNYRY